MDDEWDHLQAISMLSRLEPMISDRLFCFFGFGKLFDELVVNLVILMNAKWMRMVLL